MSDVRERTLLDSLRKESVLDAVFYLGKEDESNSESEDECNSESEDESNSANEDESNSASEDESNSASEDESNSASEDESNSESEDESNLGNEDKPLCFPNTRVTVLEKLIAWSESRRPETKNIFWISGMAGMGKSTIARTVAKHFNERGHLVASFFFDRSSAGRNDTSKFIGTIAFQLANASTILKRQIVKALGENSLLSPGFGSMVDQWNQFVKNPLLELRRVDEVKVRPLTVVLVVDALDECKGENIPGFLSVLKGLKDTKFVRFRVLITSRREYGIVSSMDELKGKFETRDLSDLSKAEVEEDLRSYIENELNKIKGKYSRKAEKEGLPKLEQGWPKQADIRQLVNNAQGLFQYARTACRIIGDPLKMPADRLEGLCKVGPSGERALDDIYLQALNLAIPDASTATKEGQDRKALLEKFRKIVGTLVLSCNPLSRSAVASLLGDLVTDMDVYEILNRLYSVLYVPKAKDSLIRVIHISFGEFLVKGCNKKEFKIGKEFHITKEEIQINEEEGHEHLFRGCIAVMSGENGLRKDLCNLKAPGIRIVERGENTDGSEVVERSEIQKRIAPEVQYACRFWVSHLGQIKDKPEIFKLALEFLKGHFLHWLEALSWMGKTSEGILAILLLEAQIPVSFLYNISNKS